MFVFILIGKTVTVFQFHTVIEAFASNSDPCNAIKRVVDMRGHATSKSFQLNLSVPLAGFSLRSC